jgi:hypothetical protein
MEASMSPNRFCTLTTFLAMKDAGLPDHQARAITYAIAQLVGIRDPLSKEDPAVNAPLR